MAIKPGYKTFTFDGQNSGTYGVYITGSAVYNAPERDVEMIKIPGRNGTFALDNGRFENIEVTYPAGIYAESQEDFAQALSDLRNMLASRRGYCRLTDEYNPDEYRMAVYKSGLDVDPVAFQRAGEFEITFECKPQRWLTSGETKQTIANSGDTLTNPTLFDSSPLLEVTGSGSIEFNGYEIELDSVPYGTIVVGEPGSANTTPAGSGWYDTMATIDTTLINIGDPIYPEPGECAIIIRLSNGAPSAPFQNVSVGATSNVLEAKTDIINGDGRQYLDLYLYPDFGSGVVYDDLQTITCSAVFTYQVLGQSTTYTKTVQVQIDYGVNSFLYQVKPTGLDDYNVGMQGKPKVLIPTMFCNSSKAITGLPVYIDCDLGDAYTIDNNNYVSLNQYIDLGSDLPKLASGSNAITYDNTITVCKITPRWWKV